MTFLRVHRLELALLVASTIAAFIVLGLVHTQIYNEPWTIDPWLYTGLMTNFGFTYYWFHATYYAARLPLIMPGIFLNSFLKPEQAYVVYHLVFFLMGALFFYLLVRSLFGMHVALFVYPAFLTNAVYVDAHTRDYFDGVVIAYLCGGLYFLVSTIGGTSRVRPALAGFFCAAAATTNLYATLLVLAAILAYLYGRATVDRRLALRRVAFDTVWFSLGALVLLGICGSFARAHGGRFFFFVNSIKALNDFSTAQWKLPTYTWMRAEPRLLIPLFVGAVAGITWRRRRTSDRSVVGFALAVAAVGIFLILAIWEFTRSGTFLQLPYYYSPIYPFFFVALATGLFGLRDRAISPHSVHVAALPLLGLVAGAVPLVAIYGFNLDDLWGGRGSVITLILMGITLAAVLSVRFMERRGLIPLVASLAAVLATTGVNYASAASATTHENFATHDSSLADADETFAIGMQLIAFMRRGDFQEVLPAFWYDPSANTDLTGIQSLYYWGFTWLNLKMPLIDAQFRVRTERIQPRDIVLLCTEPTCRHGPEAMRRAGYRIRQAAAERLHSGSESVWVRAFALEGGIATH